VTLTPARIAFDADGRPHAPDFGDHYHPRHGAAAQAQAVFLAGNGLPARWAGRTDFTLLENGFGLGLNFLATWQAWRDDPARPHTLFYVAIEAHPATPPDLARGHAGVPWPDLAAALQAAWPPAVAGLHPLEFDDGRVRLILAFGDAAQVARGLDLRADALYLDGFAPDRNPAMWTPALLRALARRLAPGATAATWTVARVVRDGLAAAGFEVERFAGVGDKRETLRARLRARAGTPPPDGRADRPPPPGRAAGPPPRGDAAPAAGTGPRRALVVGAGLAGAWVAHALARRGWTVQVIDRHPAPAQEASGNPAGLFHATVHADDGTHARLHRAAAAYAWRRLAPWIEQGRTPGRADGLLRLAAAGETLATMQARLARHGLPPALAEAWSAEAAGARAGLAPARLERPAWWFPQGGWVDPAALVTALLATPGVRFDGARPVAAIRRGGDGWSLLGADGRPLAGGDGRPLPAAPTLVLANGAGATRLWPAAGWPIGRSRGQLSLWAPAPGMPRPAVPLAGDGYVIALPDGGLVAGASAAPGDDDASLRLADHDFNRARLARLTGWTAPPPDGGRVGWRAQVPDRLPVAGPVPAADAPPSARPTQARWTAREPGLHVLTALGSRGLTWGPLMGELVAAWITGAPMPVEARLRDAVDPARWQVRRARRSGVPARED
jgi:tRNA 5-methylaminomethyl-2-thiouridine biosynthesis bifunctional protein